MKKSLITGLGIILGIMVQAQDIEETTFTEKNKTMEAFSFSNAVCNKDVLVNTWKNFIKKQGGKVKGGIVNKATGTNIKFLPSGEEWNGYFAYSFNNDNTMTVFTSFQNIQGTFLTSKSSSDEVQAVEKALVDFRLNVQKDCNLDDLNRAKAYSNSLSKEKIRNSDRIMNLEKTIRADQQKVEVSEGKTLTDKEQLSLQKVQQRIVSSEAEIETLKSRNIAIDEEVHSQATVIQRFQQKRDELDGKNIGIESNTYTEEATYSDETATQDDENSEPDDSSRQYFDR